MQGLTLADIIAADRETDFNARADVQFKTKVTGA